MFNIINGVEESLIVFIQKALSFPFLEWFFPLYTDIHKDPWFLLSWTFPLILLWIYFEGKRSYWVVSGAFIVLAITDSIGGQIIKKTFERARPFQSSAAIIALSPAAGFSFISNHAANSFAFATYLAHFYPKYKWIFFGLALLTAFSRVYNGVHYPTDVFFGGVIGFLISKMVIRVLTKILATKKMVKV